MLTGGYSSGGSSYEYAYYIKSVGFNSLTKIDVDYNYYFASGKMGSIRIYGRNSVTDKITFFAGIHDSWSGSTKRIYTNAYDAAGTALAGSSYTQISGYDSGSGKMTVNINGPNAVTLTITHQSGTKSYSFTGVGDTNQIYLIYIQHASYYSTSNYGKFDNYVETGTGQTPSLWYPREIRSYGKSIQYQYTK